jgi:uncharacterized membrane protein
VKNVIRFLALGLLGVVVGNKMEYELEWFFGLAIGLLVAALWRLSERVTALERQQAAEPARQAAGSEQRPAVAAQPAPIPAVAKERAAPPPKPVSAEAEAMDWELPREFQPKPTPTPPVAPRGDELLVRLRKLVFGGNPVVRVGLIVLFFGVGFLFKFAAERQMIPVEVRYLGVVAGAIALLVVGWRQREKRPGFAVLAQGGAVGVLYIAVFAALRLHQLIPAAPAFVLLVALVLLSGLLAVLQNARGLAVAGAIGGFIAPILASTGSGNHVALFGYYALLNAGVLGIAWYRSWRVLNLVGFFFTFGIGVAWGFRDYVPEKFATSEPFLILFFFMYVAISVLHATRQPPQLRGYVDGTLVFGLPIVAFGLQSGMVREMEFGLALSAMGVAATYLGLAVTLWRREGEGLRLLVEAFLALGVVFASLAIPLAVEGHWTAAAWALEGAALVWIGVRQNRLGARLFGLLLQFGAGFFYFDGLFRQSSGELAILNARFLGGLCLAAGGLLSAWQLRLKERLREWEVPLEPVLLGWGLLWWFGTAFSEVDAWLEWVYELHAVLAVTALTALIMSEVSRRLAWRTLALPLSATGFVVLLFLLGDLDHDHPFAHSGYLAWPVALAALYVTLRRQETMLPERVLGWQHQSGLWTVALLLAAESSWLVEQLADNGEAWSIAAWGVILPAFCLAVIRLTPRVAWPLSAWRRDYASAGPLPLLALVTAGCAVSSLVVVGDPWPLPYLPVLNPFELVQLFVLLALVRWRLLGVAPAALPTNFIDGVIAGTAFVVLNGMLARAVHFYTGVPFDWDYLLRTTELQSAFAVAWTVIALVLTVFAARRGGRRLWLIGAALLGVVVAKLFLVDLASSNTIARIVSFLGVGALMMAIGYFAPLPPARREEA